MAGEALLTVMGALIKGLAPDLPYPVLVFLRNGLGLAIILPLVLTQGGIANLRTQNLRFMVTRGLVGVSAMYCYFFSLGHLPLTEAVLLKLTGPFFIPLVALLWLGERSSWRTGLSIAVGFAGVAAILNPNAADMEEYLYVAAGLTGALLGATAKVSIRRMGVSEPSARIVVYFGLIASLASLPAALLYWQTPTAGQWLMLLALAACATLAQWLITTAYRIAPAGKMGQFTYTSVIFAALIGWLVWGEVLSVATWIGCALIVGAGLLNMYVRR